MDPITSHRAEVRGSYGQRKLGIWLCFFLGLLFEWFGLLGFWIIEFFNGSLMFFLSCFDSQTQLFG